MPTIRLKCKDCGRETTANVESYSGKAMECSYCGEVFASGEIRAAFDRAKGTGGGAPPKGKWDSLFED